MKINKFQTTILVADRNNSSIGIMCPYSGGLTYLVGDQIKVSEPCRCIGSKCNSYNKDTKKCKL